MTRTRKLILFFSLSIVVVALFIFTPWLPNNDVKPSFHDRLPNADYMATSNVLELSTALSETFYHYRLPMKELLSPGFILSQGKNYGLDIQSPIYLFLNENDESGMIEDWGGMVHVADSAKIGDGIKLISNILDLDDLIVQGTRVFYYKPNEMYIAYGENWLLFYAGNKFRKMLSEVLGAKSNDVSPEWRAIINDAELTHESIIIRSYSKKLKKRGIKTARFTLKNDSTNLFIHTVLTPYDSVSISLKPNGYHLADQEFTKSLINANVDVDKLKRNKRDPLYAILTELGDKISFPTDEFLDAWTGDIALRQGGIHTISKEYIVSELDEDFNVSEVVKSKEVKIAGMSTYLSMNDKGKLFLRSLFNKGILTREEDRVRALYSPPLQLDYSDTSLMLYTSNYTPELVEESSNFGYWSFDNTRVSFFLDSTSTFSIYGTVALPLDQIMEKIVPEP